MQVPLWVDDAWLGIRQLVAALQLVRPDAVASHATAAILFGWALPRRLQRGSRIHVATTTPEELLDRVPSWPRFRGSAQLLRVLPHVRTGVGSPQKTQLRRTIMLDGLPEPRVAHPVTIVGITFHPDLSYPRLCIAIEYEGDHHRTDSRQ